MVDVLFATANFIKHDPKQAKKMRPYPPLATLYAAGYLRQAGYAVALFDAMFADSEAEFQLALRRHRPRFVALYEDSFNFLSKMCLIRNREAACRMGEMARAAGATVIAYGPDVSCRPSIYFEHGIHYALMGEGEHSLRELLDSLTGRLVRPLAEIPGLALPAVAASGEIRRTPARGSELHLDTFPFPAWDLVDMDRYRQVWRLAHGYFSLNMAASRGCPYHCNWCAKPVSGHYYAVRSPAEVAAEMAWIKHSAQPDHLWFTDDIFGLQGEWVEEFAREVAARDASIPFTIQTRADLINAPTVAGLARAGCVEVWIGAESGSQKILDVMEKGITTQQIREARELLKVSGIRACFFIMFGYPGETFEDIAATMHMLRETMPDHIGVSVTYPLPGTKFYEMVREQLGSQTNWVDSNDLAMMFQGPYSSSFYRKLHQVVHRDLEVRRRQVAAAGEPDADLLAAIADLSNAWLELEQLEAQSRTLPADWTTGTGEEARG